MKKELTCIVCPIGCTLLVEMDGKTVKSVSGNTCPKGNAYGISECTNPKRVVTTTMRCANGEVVSVKTDAPIPKENIFECIDLINSKIADFPVKIGDVLIEEAFGARVVATQNKGENI